MSIVTPCAATGICFGGRMWRALPNMEAFTLQESLNRAQMRTERMNLQYLRPTMMKSTISSRKNSTTETMNSKLKRTPNKQRAASYVRCSPIFWR